MSERDAFESAYGRLAYRHLAGTPPRRPPVREGSEAPSARSDLPRSRLLPRLALMAPRRHPPLGV